MMDEHLALALKYRPKTFSDVIGQPHVVEILKNAITSGRIANAYLFIGPRGIGKTTLSRIFAKALNCTSPNGVEPCGECANCREIAEGRSLDVIELDAASHNSAAPKVTLIKSGFNSQSTSSVSSIFFSSSSFLGGKISKERDLPPFLYKSDTFIGSCFLPDDLGCLHQILQTRFCFFFAPGL